MNTTTPALNVSVSRVVGADPQTVWAFITDLANMGELSPENVESRWLDAEPVVGSRFRGRNRIGFLRWTTVATVTELEPGRRFAFETTPPSRSRWTYALEEIDGGTRVTESVVRDDRQPAPIRWLQRLAGVTDRAGHLQAGMTTTLERLDEATRA